MSENNGVSPVDGTISKGTGGPVEIPSSERNSDKKNFPPDRVPIEVIRIPQVCVTRYDISPYLNNANKAGKPRLNGILKRPRPNSLSDEEAHWKRLSLKCVVNLFRDDLDKLKGSGSKALNRWKTPVDSDSDTSCSDSNMGSKCKICNKSYNSEKKLLNHQKKKHIIYVNRKPMKHVSFSDHVVIHEVREYHKCRKCPKIFENYRSLKLHTKQQHKKRKCYICNYCKKSFAERVIFKVHIKLHCEVCGQHFPNKSKCVEHKRYTCRVLKLYKCKTCKESFYNIMHLKDHSYDHSNTCYVCDICKDQFESKCMIAHHISFLHEKSRPKSLYTMLKIGNERLYLCNFCEESSVERETIEGHLKNLPDLKNRAITDYKDYFFCDVCMKKFSTEQETMQHKWTHFLTTKSKEPNCILRQMLKTDKPLPMKEAKADISTHINAFETNASSNTDLNLHKLVNGYVNVHDPIPHHFKPKVLLQKLDLKEPPIGKQDFEETPKLNFGESRREHLNFGETPRENLNLGDGLRTNLHLGDGPRTNLHLGDGPRTNLHLEDGPITNLNLGEASRIYTILEEPSSTPPSEFIDIEIDIDPQALKKPIVNSKSKKTLLSKHQCQTCGKYFSNNYCLNRHMSKLHSEGATSYENLQCLVCEETFVWPSLLHSHKCIRVYRPEMQFDDARPEIHFDNLQETQFDDFNIADSDDYMNSIDFEVPAPVVSLSEGVQSGYKLVMQEVPIEF